MKTGLPDENKHVTLYDMQIKYTQPADGNDDTGDNIQELTVKNRFGRDVTFYVYSAHRKQFIKQIHKAISK